MKKMLFRKFVNRKIQTFGIITLAILWMFVSAFSINLYTTNLDFQKSYFETTKIEDFNFLPSEIEQVDEVAKQYNFLCEQQITKDFEENNTTYRMISNTEEIDIPYIVEGNAISGDNQILINQEYATANNIHVGDRMIIQEESYQVVGITTLANYIRMHVREDAYNYNENSEVLVVANPDIVKNLTKGDLGVSYLAKFDNQLSDKEKETIVSEIIRSKDFIKVTLRSENGNISTYDGKISVYFLLTVISLCVMSVIIILLLIMFLYILINEDRKTIGILIANGMKKGKIFIEYLGAVLTLLLPAGMVGYFIGFLSAPQLNTLLESDISLPTMKFTFNPVFCGLFMGLILYVVLLATLCGTIGILKKGVIDLIKNSKIKKVSRFEKFVKKISRSRTIEKKIKLSFAIRSKLLLVLVLFSVFAAGVEFFLSYSIYKLPARMKEAQESSMNFEKQVYFNNIDEKVTENDQYFYQVNGIGTCGGAESVIQVFALEEGDLLDIGVERISKNEAVINKTTADVLKAKVGDNITVSIYDKALDVTVIAISDRIVGKEVFVDYDSMVDANMIENQYSGMFTKDSTITKDSYTGITGLVSKADILLNYENSQDVMKYGSVILAILGIVIPVILIAITVSILISENRKEIAVFKANGITNKVMDNLIYSSYNGFLVLGLLISIPYSFMILNIIFSIAVKASGIKYPVDFDVICVVFAAVMTILIYFGTMFILKFRNRSTMEKINYDFG